VVRIVLFIQEEINVSSGKNIQTIIIYNSIGAKIFEENVENQQFSFDLAQFGRGVYYISVKVVMV
jgi:hypothetical protein